MGIGPFQSTSFPDVYTRTLNEAPRVTAAGALRFPAFVGVADEYNEINNYEMVRGSSSVADNLIVKEDVSSQLDGTTRNFTVSYYPIVKGDGNGTTTTSPNDVQVLVNGDPVPVSSVNGETGEIYLISIPASDDTVLATYYYKETDTLISDEDVSDQADGANTVFRTNYTPIVQGDNGGITTTTPTDVTVKVNNNPVTVSTVDGDTGQITLASAPANGDTVTVTYYTNNHQDTSDVLPSPNVTAINKVGLSPGTSDFVNGTDFVLDSTGAFHTINWGHSSKVASGQSTIGSELFDDTQIEVTLFDNHVYRREATGNADGTNTEFTIEATPMSGQGRGYPTDDPSKISAFVGTSPVDASSVDIAYMRSSTKTVGLVNPPASDSTVFVTQYSNLLPDDTWTLEVTTAGAQGIGEYTVDGENSGTAMQVQWSASDTTVSDPDFAAENVTYPAGTGPGNRDTQVMPGFAVEETVSLTFIDASSYGVTSNVTGGTGSAGDNTGYLNQTYIDGKTGFRVTVNAGDLVSYGAGDIIGYTVSPTFVTDSVPMRAIPGSKTAVSDTEDIIVGDTAIINTYNKSGNEPDIGDFYYVSFDEAKTDIFMEPQFFTLEKDLLNSTGQLSQRNKLALAGHLSFLNGAPAVSILQIEKAEDSDDAPDSSYIAGIDVYDEPMEGGIRPALMQPVTTSTGVLAYLKTSNTIQSGIRYQNERMSYFGFPNNTSPASAITYAQSMNNERMIGIYPDGGVTMVPDELGNDVEILVGGEFLAAAITGRDTSPAFDVAEPLTRKPIVGFSRLYRRLDSVTGLQVANSGLTLLEDQAAGVIVKMALTTDLSSVLTRTPSVIRIKDFVQKGARSALQTYIGIKNLEGRTGEIENTLSSYLNALSAANIIKAYTGVKATPDPNDPTIINVEAYYSPVLPLLWIVVTFNLRSSM